MVMELEEFTRLLAGLNTGTVDQSKEFWNAVTKIASQESSMRIHLARHFANGELHDAVLRDLQGPSEPLQCAVVLAVGYCFARPILARHLQTEVLSDLLSSLPSAQSFHRPLSIKCLWALANMKPAQIAGTGWPGAAARLLCEILSKKRLKEDSAVQKESLRLVERLLSEAPATACKPDHLAVWLPCVLQQTVSTVVVIRERALSVLQKHTPTIQECAPEETNNVIVAKIFYSPARLEVKPSSPFLQDVIKLVSRDPQLTNFVLDLWLALLKLTAKSAVKKTAYFNDLFSVPEYYIRHYRSDESNLASLLNSWVSAATIFSTEIPGFFSSTVQLKFFLTPFLNIAHCSEPTTLVLVRAWWSIFVIAGPSGTTILKLAEPCLQRCFRAHTMHSVVEAGAAMLNLLLDVKIPDNTDLAELRGPSPVNLEIALHSTFICASLTRLIRLSPKCFGLLLSAWGAVCDGTKGRPTLRSLLELLPIITNELPPINALSMLELLSGSDAVTAFSQATIGRHLLKCTAEDEKSAASKIAALLKRLPESDPQTVVVVKLLLNEMKSSSLGVQGALWSALVSHLMQYVDSGGDLNEGTRMNPCFETSRALTTFAFDLFNKSRDQKQVMPLCELWERWLAVYVEQGAASSHHPVPGLVTALRDGYLDWMQLTALLTCTKALVEESQPAQLSLLSAQSCPALQLFSRVIHLASKERQTAGLSSGTVSLCMELCCSAWELLTPSSLMPTLTTLASAYLTLATPVNPDNPTQTHRSIHASYTALLSCVLKHVTFYEWSELNCLEEYLIFGLQHPKKNTRLAAAAFWNKTFGGRTTTSYRGPFSERLSAVLAKEAKRSALNVPSESVSLPVPSSQSTQLSDSASKAEKRARAPPQAKGSFMAKHKGPHTPGRTTRASNKRQPAEDSQECVYISDSPKKSKVLTKHQKEKFNEQRLDRDVPVMYNSLDMNSQEPVIYDINSQSQQLSPEPVEVEPVPSDTPGNREFRKLLFLSPKTRGQTMASKSATTLLAMKSPDVSTPESENTPPPEESGEDLYPTEEESPPSPPAHISPPDSQLPGDINSPGVPGGSRMKSIAGAIKSLAAAIGFSSSQSETDTTPSSTTTATTDSSLESESPPAPLQPVLVPDTIDQPSPPIPPASSVTVVKETQETQETEASLPSLGQRAVPSSRRSSRRLTQRIRSEEPAPLSTASPLRRSRSHEEPAPPSSQSKSEKEPALPSSQGSQKPALPPSQGTQKPPAAEEPIPPSPIRKSGRNRRSSQKLRSGEFVTQGVPSSLIPDSLDTIPEDKGVEDTEKEVVAEEDESVLAETDKPKKTKTIAEAVEKKAEEKENTPSKSPVAIAVNGVLVTEEGKPRKPEEPEVPGPVLYCKTRRKDQADKPVIVVGKMAEEQVSVIPDTQLTTVPDSLPVASVPETKPASPSPVITAVEKVIPDTLEPMGDEEPAIAPDVSIPASWLSQNYKPADTNSDSQGSDGSPFPASQKTPKRTFSKRSKKKGTEKKESPGHANVAKVKGKRGVKIVSTPPDSKSLITSYLAKSPKIPRIDSPSKLVEKVEETISDRTTTIPDTQPREEEEEEETQTLPPMLDDSLIWPPAVDTSVIAETLPQEASPLAEAPSFEAVKTSTQATDETSVPPPASDAGDLSQLSENTVPSQPGGDTIPSQPGGDTVLTAGDTLPSQPGGDTLLSAPNTVPTQPDGSTVPTQPDVEIVPTQPNEDISPPLPGEDTVPTLPGEDTVLTLPGEDTVPTQPSANTMPSLPGGDTVPSQPGGDTAPSQPGEGMTPSLPGGDTVPSESSQTTMEEEDEDATQDPDKGTEKDSAQPSTVKDDEMSQFKSQKTESLPSLPPSQSRRKSNKPIKDAAAKRKSAHAKTPGTRKSTRITRQNSDLNELASSQIYVQSQTAEEKEEESPPSPLVEITMSTQETAGSPEQSVESATTGNDSTTIEEIPAAVEEGPSQPESIASVETFGVKPKQPEEVIVSLTPEPGLDTLEAPTPDETSASLTILPEATTTQADETQPDSVVEVVPEPVVITIPDTQPDSLTDSPRLIPPPGYPLDSPLTTSAKRLKLSSSSAMEEGTVTPPRLLLLNLEEGGESPTTPRRTPTSGILKRPSSASPAVSKRNRVTFGPLPEPHRTDPSALTPKRYKYRKSPVAPRRAISRVEVPEVPMIYDNVLPIYPELIGCKEPAIDVIKILCTGFTMSQRNINASRVLSTVSTVGDLARLTAQQVEELPFVPPRQTQLRRQLKKFDTSQSPMVSVRSFLSEGRLQQMLQQHRAQERAEEAATTGVSEVEKRAETAERTKMVCPEKEKPVPEKKVEMKVAVATEEGEKTGTSVEGDLPDELENIEEEIAAGDKLETCAATCEEQPDVVPGKSDQVEVEEEGDENKENIDPSPQGEEGEEEWKGEVFTQTSPGGTKMEDTRKEGGREFEEGEEAMEETDKIALPEADEKSKNPSLVAATIEENEEELPSSQEEEGLPSSQEEEELPSSQEKEKLPSSQEGEELPSSQEEEELPSSQEEEELPSSQKKEKLPGTQEEIVPSAELSTQLEDLFSSERPWLDMEDSNPPTTVVDEITAAAVDEMIHSPEPPAADELMVLTDDDVTASPDHYIPEGALVDYPLTQNKSLVEYPATQEQTTDPLAADLAALERVYGGIAQKIRQMEDRDERNRAQLRLYAAVSRLQYLNQPDLGH